MLSVIKDKIGDNLIIAAIPVIGYIVALFYQYGYASYFEFPLDFIEIDLEMTLTSSLWVAVYICLIVVVLDFYSSFIRSDGIAYIIAKSVLRFSILPFIFIFVTAFDSDIFYIFLASILMGFIFVTVPPLFSMKDKGYKEALIEDYDKNDKEDSGVSSKSSPFESYLSNFALILIFLGVCHGAGKYNAEQEKEFYIFNYNEQSYILISSCGEYIVASKFNGEDKKIVKEFSIFSPSQQFLSGFKKVELFK